jgi:hypothetical protein
MKYQFAVGLILAHHWRVSPEDPAMARANSLTFPTISPDGFPVLEREPVFDPARHLALERPDSIATLRDLGYSPEEIATCPTELGITSCFRVLSDEGVACLLEVARSLAPYIRGVERISRMVRGGAYQSRFLRDLCLSPEVTHWISEICGAPMMPHSIPHQLGHLNYNPLKLGENVDKWHVDTLRVDYVMFVTDPNEVEGGEFQYFHGTRHEAKALHRAGQKLPADRTITPRLPGAGYAVLQQGNMVVHRATGLRRSAERITMVNGYVPGDPDFPDYTRFDQLFLADPPHIAASEYARHVAWVGRERLQAFIDRAVYSADRAALAAELDAVASYLSKVSAEIRDARDVPMEHFGDG